MSRGGVALSRQLPDLPRARLRLEAFSLLLIVPRFDFPGPIADLVSTLKALPGVGPRSAERMAIWMLGQGSVNASAISDAIVSAQQTIGNCPSCGFYIVNDASACSICEDSKRNSSQLCVVEQPTDIPPIERTGAFDGLYHALGGKLSPLDNVTPDDIRIGPLIARVQGGGVSEVILAMSSDVEGEATANYIASMLDARTDVSVTRLAQGMPAGGGLDNADELTLLRALDGRRKME